MVIAAVDDLMFGSKVRAACERAGKEVTFARTREAVLSDVSSRRPELVILDLDRGALDPIGVIQAIRQDDAIKGTRVVAFVRHTSTDAIVAARKAGADVVLARSAFFPALAGMLAGSGAADT
jgi:DNA-binding response OmpR family regulator